MNVLYVLHISKYNVFRWMNPETLQKLVSTYTHLHSSLLKDLTAWETLILQRLRSGSYENWQGQQELSQSQDLKLAR